jgi:hypothetical protein
MRVVTLAGGTIMAVGLAFIAAVYAVLVQCPNGAICADANFSFREFGLAVTLIGAGVLVAGITLRKNQQ